LGEKGKTKDSIDILFASLSQLFHSKVARLWARDEMFYKTMAALIVSRAELWLAVCGPLNGPSQCKPKKYEPFRS
jgi:hypothetical protein